MKGKFDIFVTTMISGEAILAYLTYNLSYSVAFSQLDGHFLRKKYGVGGLFENR